MKTFTALVLACMLFSASIAASLVLVSAEPAVGVKEGYWIEYDISMTGKGAPPPTHDVRWMRITILPVQDTAFSANFTVRYSNGTIGSAIWKYNFTEGNVEGWTIIPGNLSPGDIFYDLSQHNKKPVNVTVQREEQKTVLGASRAVTYGNDSFRHKEWDKATGMFIGSSERLKNVTNKDGWYIEDITATVKAVATNIWSPQILGLDQTFFYTIVVAVVVAGVAAASAIAVTMRKRKLGNRYFVKD